MRRRRADAASTRRASARGARFPREIERRYRGDLLRRLDVLKGVVLEQIGANPLIRADALDDFLISIGNAETTVRRVHQVSAGRVAGRAGQLDLFQTRQVTRLVGAIPTVSILFGDAQVQLQIDAWTATNVRLIKTVDSRYFADLRAMVAEATERGLSTQDLARQIQAKSGDASRKGRNNATRIARDQIGSLNSQITQSRYQAAGIERYVWTTSRDEVVRPEHVELDGQSFEVGGAGAPGEGHPGEPINCRCVARPITRFSREFDPEAEQAEGARLTAVRRERALRN